MSTLILYLPLASHGPAAEYSYTLTSDGHTPTRHASAPAALLPEPARRGGEVVAIVPAAALSWQRVTLPKGVPTATGGPAPRLRAVLEGLLEEHLLDDPAQLHFALEPDARTEAPVWVAVCNRQWLQSALQALEAAGRPVSRVVPEFAPGATNSGSPELYALGTPEAAHWVGTGQGSDLGVTMLPLSASTLALLELGDGPVRAEPAVAALAEAAVGQSVVLHTASERALTAARSDWDLAQFELASSSRTRALRKAGSAFSSLLNAPQWRAARWGAATLVAAHLIGLNTWAWQERQSLAAKQAGVRNALTQTFPHISAVVDAPVQMEREVSRLRQAAGGVSARDLEPMLAALGAALPPDRQPSAIEYSPGELRLRGLNLTAAELPAIAPRLAGLRLQAEDGALLARPETTP